MLPHQEPRMLPHQESRLRLHRKFRCSLESRVQRWFRLSRTQVRCASCLVSSASEVFCALLRGAPVVCYLSSVSNSHLHDGCTITVQCRLKNSKDSDSLSLSDSVLAYINPCFSRHGFLNSRSDSLSEFISTWFCRFHLRCKQRVSRTTSHVSVCFNIRR